MRKSSIGILFILFVILTGCDKWFTTEDVSHVSPLPEFTFEGGEFFSISQSDSDNFVEPVVTAKSGETELTVYKYGTIDFTKIGVNIITYYARNADGLSATAQQIIAVNNVDVTNNDLSGTYILGPFGNQWNRR
jgi:hypothetical protein